jgi:hypothetical protein
MNYGQDFGYGTASDRGLLYYLIFPLDTFGKRQHEADYQVFNEQKRYEIWPLFIFLLPAIVLAAGMMLNLGFFSAVFFYGLESLFLAAVCKFYAQLDDMAYLLDLALNFWLAFLLWSLVFIVIFSIVGIFF